MNKSITKTITFIAAIAAIVVGYLSYTFRDKLSGYSIDRTLTPPDSVVIQVGVGISNITPSIDGNKVWIAGFDPGRKAIGTHDSLWARAMVIDDGKNRLALVSIDAIGLYHNNIIGALQNISEELSISYAVVSSTHSHEAPDLMGLWGPSRLRGGDDKAYISYVQNGIIEAISKATYNLEPSYLVCAYDSIGCRNVVKDTRDPIVYDSEVRVLQARSLADNSIITTLVSTGNHPESIWNKNQYISSDFPHYVRKTLEDSIGGTAIFMQGCLGGLMCPHPSIPIVHPISGDTLLNASWERTEAIGMTIANAAIRALDSSNATTISSEGISLRAKSFSLKISNKLYILAA